MTDKLTIARPYAKAIFETALDKNNLLQWSNILQCLAEIALDSQAKYFIANPLVNMEEKIQILKGVVEDSGQETSSEVESFLRLLAAYKRLVLLPEIKFLFEELYAEQKRTISVKVFSYSPLSKEQQEKLIMSLSGRFQRQVSLDIHIDKSLLGGARIQVADYVIDGSVRSQLNHLSANLAA